MTDDKMLARIAALLRQAEGTDNAHEADAPTLAGFRLASRRRVGAAALTLFVRTEDAP